jgi:hypothetical protein
LNSHDRNRWALPKFQRSEINAKPSIPGFVPRRVRTNSEFPDFTEALRFILAVYRTLCSMWYAA